jgi:hypothetical protein
VQYIRPAIGVCAMLLLHSMVDSSGRDRIRKSLLLAAASFVYDLDLSDAYHHI